ncbi:hypothetical protein HGB07_05270 [Candidatus Roizmanbacteria bacterium]|nr:hypothetical protein [Candidatus Roizmanbacteria bacterium]
MVTEEEKLPTIQRFSEERKATLIFSSNQNNIMNKVTGPTTPNYRGVCLGLVMIWFENALKTEDPLKGKVAIGAINLQAQLGLLTWNDIEGFMVKRDKFLAKWKFWTKLQNKYTIDKECSYKLTICSQFTRDRESIYLIVLYPKKGGGAHAIGVWRSKDEKYTIYDPNYGACEMLGDSIVNYMRDLINTYYSEMGTYLLCSWVD